MASLNDTLLESLFPESSGPKTVVPFPSAMKTKKGPPLVNNDWVRDAVGARSLGDVELVDPSQLHATQSWVTKPGVLYYLGDNYELTGETYADKHLALNRFPVVYVRSDGEARLLSGHHRSTAALLRQEPVLAIVVREPWPGSRPSAKLLTPRLFLGSPSTADSVNVETERNAHDAVSAIRGGQRLAVPTAELALAVLEGLGVEPKTAEERVRC